MTKGKIILAVILILVAAGGLGAFLVPITVGGNGGPPEAGLTRVQRGADVESPPAGAAEVRRRDQADCRRVHALVAPGRRRRPRARPTCC